MRNDDCQMTVALSKTDWPPAGAHLDHLSLCESVQEGEVDVDHLVQTREDAFHHVFAHVQLVHHAPREDPVHDHQRATMTSLRLDQFCQHQICVLVATQLDSVSKFLRSKKQVAQDIVVENPDKKTKFACQTRKLTPNVILAFDVFGTHLLERFLVDRHAPSLCVRTLDHHLNLLVKVAVRSSWNAAQTPSFRPEF